MRLGPRCAVSRRESCLPLAEFGEPIAAVDEQSRRFDGGERRHRLTQSQCDVCAVSVEAVESVMGRKPALARTRLLTLNPRSLAEVLLDVERIGDAAGAGNAGREYSASLRERIAAVQAAAPAAGRGRPRVAVIEWLDPLMVAGNWTPEIVEIAGGEYGLASKHAPSPYVAWPEIAQYAPDLLVVAPCGFDLTRSQREAQQLQSLPPGRGWRTRSSG
jgi:iron complex transport system substrate-binding protein